MKRTLADKIRDFGRAMSVEEVASIIPVNVSTIYRMAKADRVPCFKLGGRVWFDCFVLADWYEDTAVI